MSDWDWDRSDPRQHCEHGTFIGSWWGPDLMCGWCEDGISAEDPKFKYERFWFRNTLRKERRRALREFYDYCSDKLAPSWMVFAMHGLDDQYRVRKSR